MFRCTRSEPNLVLTPSNTERCPPLLPCTFPTPGAGLSEKRLRGRFPDQHLSLNPGLDSRSVTYVLACFPISNPRAVFSHRGNAV